MIAVYLFCMLMFVIFAGFLVAILGIIEDSVNKQNKINYYDEVQKLLKEKF